MLWTFTGWFGRFVLHGHGHYLGQDSGVLWDTSGATMEHPLKHHGKTEGVLCYPRFANIKDIIEYYERANDGI